MTARNINARMRLDALSYIPVIMVMSEHANNHIFFMIVSPPQGEGGHNMPQSIPLNISTPLF